MKFFKKTKTMKTILLVLAIAVNANIFAQNCCNNFVIAKWQEKNVLFRMQDSLPVHWSLNDNGLGYGVSKTVVFNEAGINKVCGSYFNESNQITCVSCLYFKIDTSVNKNVSTINENIECIDSTIITGFWLDGENPVCGCNNVTYKNETYAKESGVLRWTLGECCSSKSAEPQNNFLLTPNPANNYFAVQPTPNNIKIYNNMAVMVLDTNKNKIDTSNLPDGVYYAIITVNDQKNTQKIIISH